jgi:hypothetical protein
MLLSACCPTVIRGVRPVGRSSGVNQLSRRNSFRIPLLHGLVEPVVRVRAVDQDRAQGTVGIPAGPVRPDERPVGPAHQQRPVHIPGRENGIDIPDGGHEGIVRGTRSPWRQTPG